MTHVTHTEPILFIQILSFIPFLFLFGGKYSIGNAKLNFAIASVDMGIYDKISDGLGVAVAVVSLYHKVLFDPFFYHFDIANWIIFYLAQWIHRVEPAIFGFDYCLIISTEFSAVIWNCFLLYLVDSMTEFAEHLPFKGHIYLRIVLYDDIASKQIAIRV